MSDKQESNEPLPFQPSWPPCCFLHSLWLAQTQNTGIIHNILKLNSFSNLSTKLIVWHLISYPACCSISFFSLDKHHLAVFPVIQSAITKIIVLPWTVISFFEVTERKKKYSNERWSSAFKTFTAFWVWFFFISRTLKWQLLCLWLLTPSVNS